MRASWLAPRHSASARDAPQRLPAAILRRIYCMALSKPGLACSARGDDRGGHVWAPVATASLPGRPSIASSPRTAAHAEQRRPNVNATDSELPSRNDDEHVQHIPPRTRDRDDCPATDAPTATGAQTPGPWSCLRNANTNLRGSEASWSCDVCSLRSPRNSAREGGSMICTTGTSNRTRAWDDERPRGHARPSSCSDDPDQLPRRAIFSVRGACEYARNTSTDDSENANLRLT